VLNNKTVASILGISPLVVHDHISSMLQCTGCVTWTQLAQQVDHHPFSAWASNRVDGCATSAMAAAPGGRYQAPHRLAEFGHSWASCQVVFHRDAVSEVAGSNRIQWPSFKWSWRQVWIGSAGWPDRNVGLSDWRTVSYQLLSAFEHFNEVHPNSSLDMRLLREFRWHQVTWTGLKFYCE